MSQSIRQSELFAGADWRVLYRAFTAINFNASDPESIGRALRDYVRTYYPEEFTDWIESSEFVRILDVLAYLAGSLAYKTDMAARENFFDSAESRESILRLARFLSYTPRRNQPARGLLKLVEVRTNDDITDAFGTNLNNIPVAWDDPDDEEWFEKFTLILNSAFTSNLPFGGGGLRDGTVGGVPTTLYRVNARMGNLSLSFSANAAGERMNFEVVNVDFEDGGGFFERVPNDESAFHLCYRNDGNGNASPRTGFFALFKQGTTSTETFTIGTPVENLLVDLGATGVNDSDVWVQSLNNDGTVAFTWEKVPAIFSQNITFNNITADTRAIYSVITRAGDAVTLRFGDGRFSAAPSGLLRATYRVSNGLQYTLRPADIERVTISLPYFNRSGVERILTLTFSLTEPVTNALPRETDEQVRQRAPSVYAAQNRMVSGEDYNTFPLQGNVATKLKALNRVYSGHSRHIDLNDPTGTFQDTTVVSDDGILYIEDATRYRELPLTQNLTADDLIITIIQPMVSAIATTQFMRERFLDHIAAGLVAFNTLMWTQATASGFSSTGRFSHSDPYLVPGAAVRVSAPTPYWVLIADTVGAVDLGIEASRPGPVTLAEPVPDGAAIVSVLPRYASVFGAFVITAMGERIRTQRSFTLWYNHAASDADSHWMVGDLPGAAPDPTIPATAIQVATVFYGAGVWRVSVNGSRYVFESGDGTVHWYNSGRRAIDSATGRTRADLIRVLKINEDINNDGRPFEKSFDLTLGKVFLYPDGRPEPRRVLVHPQDADADGFPDDPETFRRLMPTGPAGHLFWKRDVTQAEPMGVYRPTNAVTVFEREQDRLASVVADGTVAFQMDSTLAHRRNTFWVHQDGAWVQDTRNWRHAIGRGPNVAARWIGENEDDVPQTTALNYIWKHVAPSDHRIDPARSNIVDMIVLTSEYDFQTRQWIRNGADPAALPSPPTELDLRLAFKEYEKYAMFSDQIVWRPASYRFLFGPGAADEHRAQFKVVRLPSSPLSDGEIKSRVIRAINEYFDVSRWEFGEVFYFTELAAYIHQQLATVIGSIVLVPLNDDASFGDGFEVRCRSDEMFISTAQVSDVIMINSNTSTNLRIR